MASEHIQPLKDFIFNDLSDEIFPKETHKSLDGLMFNAPTTLRLTHFGYNIMRNIYDHKSFPLEDKLTGRELLTLKNHVTWPYYLPANHGHLHLFTIKQVFVLKLNGGDVKKWLKNLYEKNSK